MKASVLVRLAGVASLVATAAIGAAPTGLTGGQQATTSATTAAAAIAPVAAPELITAPPADEPSSTQGAVPAERWPADVIPTLDWKPCHKTYECATARVPRDYDDLRGPKIDLAMVRLPATDKARRIGSLFINPGGPGGSGISIVLGAPPQALALFPRFDIVGWDPRGVGESRPAVDCTTDAEDAAGVGGFFTRPEDVDREAAIAAAKKRAESCLQRNPDILPYLSTANVATDLDLMRAAVRDPQLSYLGISHGTAIGATYALFPGRARAMLMDSALDPDVWNNRPFESGREQLAGFEETFDRFFTECAVQQDECGFGGDDPEAAYDALVASMNENPVPAPNGTFHEPVTGDEVQVAAFTAMYSPRNWDVLATALAEAANGDASLMRDLVSAATGRRADGSWAPEGVFEGTLYQDGVYPRATDPYFAEGVHAVGYSKHFFGLAFNQTSLILNPTINPTPKNDVFRGPWKNPSWANPMLVIGGTYDPATPYPWAQRYVSQLGNARLLTYNTDGHGAITDLNPCIIKAVVDYIEKLKLPEVGASCSQDFDPFTPGTPAPDASAWSVEAPEVVPTLVRRP